MLVVLLQSCAAEPDPLILFAAASATDASSELAIRYLEENQVRMAVSTGSTSTLVRQTAAGAPVDAVLLVGEQWTHWLSLKMGGVAAPTLVARGRLAIVIPRDASEWDRLEEITAVDRLALADPAHVPAGVYAREMLEAAGLWPKVESRVVPFPHVRAALAAVETGQADAAVVYASDLTVSTRVKQGVIVPDSIQPRVSVYCVSVQQTPPRDICAFAREHREVWRRHGFLPAS